MGNSVTNMAYSIVSIIWLDAVIANWFRILYPAMLAMSHITQLKGYFLWIKEQTVVTIGRTTRQAV